MDTNETMHTPGPWVATNIDNEWWIGSDDRNVGAVWGFADHPMNAADARLIAAAPELLEALKQVVANVLDYEKVNNFAPNPGRKYCWDCVERAVAAIEKATGSPL